MKSQAFTQEAESIGALVAFHNRKVEPIAFHWGKNRYQVDKVNLTYRRRDGGKLYYHFAVSSGGNTFDLCFDSVTLEWYLWKAQEAV
ncbi:MAG: hypothetical protein V1853_01020 [bacterium]